MQMMYEVIYKALQEVGLENKYEPQDYLNFFCLGTRESSNGVETTAIEKGSNAANAPQVAYLIFLTNCSISLFSCFVYNITFFLFHKAT